MANSLANIAAISSAQDNGAIWAIGNAPSVSPAETVPRDAAGAVTDLPFRESSPVEVAAALAMFWVIKPASTSFLTGLQWLMLRVAW